MKKQRFILFLFILFMMFFIIKPNTGTAADIVNPKQVYTYDKMVQDIKALEKKYPDIITYKIIGYSEYQLPIYAVSIGTGNANTFINGSHHGREWITTNLTMKMIEEYAKKYKGNQSFGGFNVQKVLDETTIWFVPMVNPDGVTLQQFGTSKFPTNQHKSLVRMNDGSTNFKKWKANAKGIDLNRQYNADWSSIRGNISSPWWYNHKGQSAEQASEVKAMVKFTKEINPEMAISYHTSGEVLYWNYKQTGSRFTRDHEYAKRIGQYTGYSLIYPGVNPSGGGYTDWFISTYKRPAFTPELAPYAGNTNVPLSRFDRIWQQNRYIGLYTASEGYKLYIARGGKPKPREVNVTINGEKPNFTQPAIMRSGRTIIPVRGVFEQLGATVEWNGTTETVIVRKGSTLVELKLGSKTMNVNGVKKTLSTAPESYNYSIMIPLRAVSEAIGAGVSWDQKTSTAKITLVKEKPKPAPIPLVVYINGVEQAFDQPPVMESGRTIVPLRGIFESLGASVQWDSEHELVTANRSETEIQLKIGSKSPTVNGEVVSIDVPAKLTKGRTLVPLRFVGEALGATVNYDDKNKRIDIISQ